MNEDWFIDGGDDEYHGGLKQKARRRMVGSRATATKIMRGCVKEEVKYITINPFRALNNCHD